MAVPKLRFKEFEGEWKKDKVGELCDCIVPGRNKPKLFNGNIAWITTPDIVHHDYVLRSKIDLAVTSQEARSIGSKIVPKNSVIISCVGDLGLVALAGVELVINQQLHAFLPSQRIEHRFLMYSISTQEKYIDSVATKTAVPYLNKNNCNSIPVFFPTLPEQQKIAGFLGAVDQKIQQLTQKKALLEEYKKGVMQQIFSQQIRFKPAQSEVAGQEDGKDFPDWEEKRLDSVISKFVVPMRDKPKFLNGEIPWCRIEDFDGKYLEKSKSGQGVSYGTVKEMNLKVYPVGTLLVSCSANLGFCAITKAELITNQTFIGLVPNDSKVDVLYLLYIMRLSSRSLNILSSGTTISYLSRRQFEQFKIPYPSLLEQQKIATFLSGIDTKIEGVEKQLTQTQTFKKGLLQQMFV